MTTKTLPVSPSFGEEALDRLFLDCTELETAVASIRQAIDKLDPAVESGLVTAEHLMVLAFRIERAERGLITIAHRMGHTATSLIERRNTESVIH